MFRPFGIKTNYLTFKYEYHWWRLFQKHVVHTKLDLQVFIVTPSTFVGYCYFEYILGSLYFMFNDLRWLFLLLILVEMLTITVLSLIIIVCKGDCQDHTFGFAVTALCSLSIASRSTSIIVFPVTLTLGSSNMFTICVIDIGSTNCEYSSKLYSKPLVSG